MSNFEEHSDMETLLLCFSNQLSHLYPTLVVHKAVNIMWEIMHMITLGQIWRSLQTKSGYKGKKPRPLWVKDIFIEILRKPEWLIGLLASSNVIPRSTAFYNEELANRNHAYLEDKVTPILAMTALIEYHIENL